MMTKRELIKALSRYEDDAMIYVPSSPTGCNGTLVFIARVDHSNLIPGVSMAPDLAFLPGNMEHFVTDSDDPEIRMGNLSYDPPIRWHRRLRDWLIRRLR